MRVVACLALVAAASAAGSGAIASHAAQPAPRVGRPCTKSGKVATAPGGTRLKCTLRSGKLRWARAGGASPATTTTAPSTSTPSSPAATTFLVSVHGTMTYDSTTSGTTEYPGGGSCTVVLTTHSRDTLSYATDSPLRVTVSGGSGSAHASVPYTFTLKAGSVSTSTPSGTGPNGSACPPFQDELPRSGCHAYSGTLPLDVEVEGRKVTVSSTGSVFPSAPCPGSTPGKVFVVAASGTLPDSGHGTVGGSGHEDTAAGFTGDSTFEARFTAP